MRRAVWTEGGLRVQDDEPPPLPEGWVRLRVEACGICGSDLHFWHGDTPRPLGTSPGHEAAGSVLDGPAGLADALYAVSPNVTCGRCDHCAAGDPQLCRRGGYGIGLGRDGALAEYLDAPVANLFPVDSRIDAVVASITEPLAVCARGVGLAAPEPDSRVLVLGAGSVGLLSALVARDRVLQVAITARHAHQRELATRLGAVPLGEDEAEAWGNENRPDVVIETVGGAADTLGLAIRAARRGARIVVLGAFQRPVELDMFAAVFKELAILGSFAYGTGRRGQEFKTAVDLLPRFREELPALQTHQFPLEEVEDAFRCAADKKSGAVKVTIVPGAQ